jgi:curved DNA-binding protein
VIPAVRHTASTATPDLFATVQSATPHFGTVFVEAALRIFQYSVSPGARMEFKDYYARLGLARTASPDEIKRAYRKLARKYHPDVSKETDAEAQFKEVAEAYEALKDPQRRTAYDAIGQRREGDPVSRPPPGWNSDFDFSNGTDRSAAMDHGDFFEALFGRAASGAAGGRAFTDTGGEDVHATLRIGLLESYRGGRRTVSLQVPTRNAQGIRSLQLRHLDVNIPKGIRDGQHLRLKGQGEPGHGAAPAGDLFLEVHFNPHRLYRLDGRDVYIELPVAPWEAALGASVTAPAPDGSVNLTIPSASSSGRKLRLRGKGLPGTPPGDLYAVLTIALPPADTEQSQAAYRTLASSFEGFDPRAPMEQ